ncbi:MAG TPA: outer membrane beta-barrel protein [Pyrinomonadaceae bacterium]|nr:outer membrane beta-barrel protein [Pyrinomonadaceae bacterium]
MKRLALLTIALFASFTIASAQTDKKPEFFAGYSYESVDTGIKTTDLTSTTTTSLDNRFKLNGLNLSATGYLTRRLGVTGDFSANFENRADVFGTDTGNSKVSLYNFTGGPQLRFPSTSKFTPYVHVLAGFARRSLTETFTTGTTNNFTDSNTSFAMNFGGGVDYRLKNRFAWRLVQFDYNPILLRGRTINTVSFPDRTLNGFRFSTGIVIK